VKRSIIPVRRWLARGCGAAVDLLFPPRCVACAADLSQADSRVMLCRDCRDQLPLIEWPVCLRCAAPVPTTDGVELACNHCRGDKLRFDRTMALGAYEGNLRQLVMRMKTDRSQLVANTLVELAWQELGARLLDLNVTAIAPVPMHLRRRWQRGVDPPRAMAERIAAKLGVPAAVGLLRLKRNVAPQVGLSRPGRFRNIAGEMAVRSTYHLQAAHVLLVDDILTTGATCSEAARVLKRAGAKQVTVFVMTRTPAGD
jgi:ComF family protein